MASLVHPPFGGLGDLFCTRLMQVVFSVARINGSATSPNKVTSRAPESVQVRACLATPRARFLRCRARSGGNQQSEVAPKLQRTLSTRTRTCKRFGVSRARVLRNAQAGHGKQHRCKGGSNSTSFTRIVPSNTRSVHGGFAAHERCKSRDASLVIARTWARKIHSAPPTACRAWAS